MMDIKKWMNTFLNAVNATFTNRIWFVGLQGSYGRGEATETSDIDVVIILDQLSATDIQAYNAMLDGISWKCLPNTITAKPYYEKAKAAYQAAYDACGNIAEFAEIKVLLEKNINNLTISIEEANKIITFCDGNGGKIDTTNYEDMVAKLETYNAGFWNNDYKDHTVGNNKKLVKEIKW